MNIYFKAFVIGWVGWFGDISSTLLGILTTQNSFDPIVEANPLSYIMPFPVFTFLSLFITIIAYISATYLWQHTDPSKTQACWLALTVPRVIVITLNMQRWYVTYYA